MYSFLGIKTIIIIIIKKLGKWKKQNCGSKAKNVRINSRDNLEERKSERYENYNKRKIQINDRTMKRILSKCKGY